MHLRRFYSQTVTDALAQVRSTLGPDALVLSTRLAPIPGWRGWLGSRHVELTAAVERQVSDARPAASVPRHGGAGRSRARPRGDAGAELVARLCASGLDRDFAAEVVAALPDTRCRAVSGQTLERTLAARLAELVCGDDAYAPVEVFVGPPGAGKTTTIAKIAAQERARGGARLGLVSADGYRVGAIEQLGLYAKILDVPFASVRTIDDLERVLGQPRQPLLVDTAGRHTGDAPQRELFDALSGRPGVRTHLVLAAGTRARDADRIVDQYQAARPDRVVLTKLDETDSLSPLVRLLRARAIPVSYVGTGQRVPQDLRRATAPLLAACVLGELDTLEVPA